MARAGMPADRVAPDDPLWERIADELAELMAMLILSLSPQRIVIGGGVVQNRPALLALIRARTYRLLRGYVAGVDAEVLARMIVQPRLGASAGPLGAVALALAALGSSPRVH